ncbi:Alpha/beta hydrolase fold-1 [Xylariaceae sp. FL0594]|nr:Alpha/beta hydrolase fold-1 [Xylariaceae sp. FL0594]
MADTAGKPVIILVQGAWHLPDVWHMVKAKLEAADYEVYTLKLLTAVGPEPVHHSWRVDVAVVHDIAIPLFNQGRRAVIVGHSYGGLVTTASVQGQTVEDRQARGLKGGFSAIVYLCAFPIANRGSSLLSEGGGQYNDWMITAEAFKNIPFSIKVIPELGPFYNDLPPEEAQYWVSKLQHQSQRSLEEPLEFGANDIKIPMTYLLCEADKTVPIRGQEYIVSTIPAMKTRRCTAGHSPFLSQPDLTTDLILEVARDA